MQFGVISEERKTAISIAGNSRFDIVWIHFFYHSFPALSFGDTTYHRLTTIARGVGQSYQNRHICFD